MERAKGILYAALSSSTFGLAPLFTLLLLAGGYSPFEALSYRWGVAALFLGVLAVFSGRSFRLGRRELVTVFLLSLFRAATSLSLIIAYQHIASGVASTIHFMYPLAVALAMMCFFREKGSAWVFAAIGMSVVGAVLLSLGNVDFTVENSALGMVSACVSVFSYGGYIVGVRKSRAVEIDSAVLTCYVMGLGALYFILGGLLTGGVRIETDGMTWLCILGLALPATALSNMTLVHLRKLERGGSEHSFGIHVAKMAGMPKTIVKRADEILHQLEKENRQEGMSSHHKVEPKTVHQDGVQLSFFQLDDPVLCQIRDEILNLDVNNLTPLEALNKLNDIKKIVRGK